MKRAVTRQDPGGQHALLAVDSPRFGPGVSAGARWPGPVGPTRKNGQDIGLAW